MRLSLRTTVIATVLAVSLIGISMSVAYADRPANQQPTSCPSCVSNTGGTPQTCMTRDGGCPTGKMGRHCPMCRFVSGHRLGVGIGLLVVASLLVVAYRLRKINKTLERIAKKIDRLPPPTA